jgi:hypothetical protein
MPENENHKKSFYSINPFQSTRPPFVLSDEDVHSWLLLTGHGPHQVEFLSAWTHCTAQKIVTEDIYTRLFRLLHSPAMLKAVKS